MFPNFISILTDNRNIKKKGYIFWFLHKYLDNYGARQVEAVNLQDRFGCIPQAHTVWTSYQEQRWFGLHNEQKGCGLTAGGKEGLG